MKRRPIEYLIPHASRREFIRTGALAIGALAAGARAATSVHTGNSRFLERLDASKPYVTVFDHRYEASVCFASHARGLGVCTRDLDCGDVTNLWYNDLYHRWKIGPAAIAGLTTEDALIVLEGFGNDAGLRRVFTAEHWIEGWQVVHRFRGPANMVRRLSLSQYADDWTAGMARLISRCPLDHDECVVGSATTQLTASEFAAPVRLVSWLLTPGRQLAIAARSA